MIYKCDNEMKLYKFLKNQLILKIQKKFQK